MNSIFRQSNFRSFIFSSIIGSFVVLFTVFLLAGSAWAQGSLDTADKVNAAAGKEAYQRYMAAYNKLNMLISQGKGGTTQAQTAYKKYESEKERYEKFLKENEAKNTRPKDEKNEQKADNNSGDVNNSMQDAYDRYIAAYKKLIRMVTETPILGPPEMKKVSDTYQQDLTRYNRSKDRRDYQAYIATHNRLTSMALKVRFTGPPTLKKAQEDYDRAKAEYTAWMQK